MKNAVVLIVEDEALIRQSAVQIVEDAGYTALEACNADEAVMFLESRSDIAAVFTDIKMPGSMDGLTLAHAVRARWAPIHLIVTSGTNVQGELPANSRFMHKPYSARHVTTALSELFSSHQLPTDS